VELKRGQRERANKTCRSARFFEFLNLLSASSCIAHISLALSHSLPPSLSPPITLISSAIFSYLSLTTSALALSFSYDGSMPAISVSQDRVYLSHHR